MRFVLLLVVVVINGCRGGSPPDESHQTADRLPLVATTAHFAPSDSLLGVIVPPDPDGYAHSGGMTLNSTDTTRWGMGLFIRDSIRYLNLDSLHHVTGGRAYWKIIDATALPPLKPTEEFAWVDCAVENTPDASVAAIGVWHDTMLTQIRYAVRPNVRQRRFEILPVAQVSCVVSEDRN